MILWFNSDGARFINFEIVDTRIEYNGIKNPNLWCDWCSTGYFYVGY